MKPMKAFKSMILIARLQARQAWYHRLAALATVLSWGLRMGLTILLYRGIYNALGTTDIKGIDLSVAASSMLLYVVFSGFGSRDVFRGINADFKSGAIEIWLNKPIAYLVMKISETMGKNLPSAGVLIGVVMVFWAITGLPKADHIGLRFLAGVPLLFMGIIVANLLYALVGLSAVWMSDATATNLIVDKFIMIFGGIYIPIAFFPDKFRAIGEFLPTGAVTFTSQIFYPDFFDNYARFISILLMWTVILGAALFFANKSVSRHMTVNGG